MSFKRSTADVLQFVCGQMQAALQRPKMYGLTPDGLETYLTTLNLVREYIEHPQSDGHGAEIARHMMALGYGSASICERWRIDSRPGSDDKRFQEIVEVWRAFLDKKSPIDPPSEGESI